MTFSDYILRKFKIVPITMSKKEPEPRKNKTRRPALASLRDIHFPRCPGITRREYGWTVFKNVKENDKWKTVRVGDSYPTFLRARVSQKLYDYWLTCGFPHTDIPVTLNKSFHQRGRRK